MSSKGSWLGLSGGVLLVHAAKSAERAGGEPLPVWPLALVAAFVAVLIAVPAMAWSPHWLDRLSAVVTGTPLAPAHAVSLGLVLLLIARGVLLRRRAAWYGLVALVVLG